MGLEYFPCFYSYRKKIAKLSDQEVGRLFRHLLEYGETGETEELTGREAVAFDFIADDINRAKAEYISRCEKNRANASGRNRTQANGSETSQTKTKTKTKTEDKDLLGDKSPCPAPSGTGQQKKEFEPDSKPYLCAVYLAESVKSVTGKEQKEKTLQNWAYEFDKCNRIDGNNWDEIKVVLAFARKDSFWKANILSGDAFRRQYDKLKAKMTVQKENEPSSGSAQKKGSTGNVFLNLYKSMEAEEGASDE